MYGDFFKESWRRLFKNLELFVPDVIFYVVSGIVALLIINQLGLSDLFVAGDSLLQSKEALVNFLSTLSPSFILSAIFYFILFVIVTFIVGSGTDVAKYNMMTDVLLKKKINFIRSLTGGAKKFFWRYVGMKILTSVMVLLSLFVLYLIYALVAGGNTLVSLVLITLIVMIFFGLWFYFLVPILFLKDIGLNPLFVEGFMLLKKKLSVIVLTFLTIFGVGLAVSIIFEIFDMLFKSFLPLLLINIIVAIIIEVWADLFKFMIYNKIKKAKY